VEGSKILLIFAVAAVLAFSYQEAEANGQYVVVIHDEGGGECSQIGTWNQEKLACTMNKDIVDLQIEIRGNLVTLDGAGHSVTNSEKEVPGCYAVPDGIEVWFSEGVTIEDVTVSGFRHGIEFIESDYGIVRDSTVTDNCRAGIALYGSPYGVVEGNTVTLNGDDYDGFGDDEGAGIFLDSSDNSIIRSNNVNQNNAGIVQIYSDDNIVDKNIVNDNIGGIVFYGSDYNSVAGNTIDNNAVGMYLQDGRYNLIGAKPSYGEPGEFEFDCREIFDDGDFTVDGNIIKNSVTGLIVNTKNFDYERPLSDYNCIVDNQISGSENRESVLDDICEFSIDECPYEFFEDFKGDGVGFWYTDYTQFVRNVVWDNDGDGMHVIDADDDTYDRNRIQDNGDEGIESDEGDDNNYICNAIGFSNSGIDFEDDSENNIVHRNTFYDNRYEGIDNEDGNPDNEIFVNDFFRNPDHVNNDDESTSIDRNFYDANPEEDDKNPANEPYGLCDGVPDIPDTPVERTSNGGDNQWDTRPTFGVSHETRQGLIVENGFSFNGDYFTVTDNHHTDFAEQSVEIGTMNSFTATEHSKYKSSSLEFQM
jgi:parallel beta-helix repeat protein